MIVHSQDETLRYVGLVLGVMKFIERDTVFFQPGQGLWASRRSTRRDQDDPVIFLKVLQHPPGAGHQWKRRYAQLMKVIENPFNQIGGQITRIEPAGTGIRFGRPRLPG